MSPQFWPLNKLFKINTSKLSLSRWSPMKVWSSLMTRLLTRSLISTPSVTVPKKANCPAPSQMRARKRKFKVPSSIRKTKKSPSDWNSNSPLASATSNWTWFTNHLRTQTWLACRCTLRYLWTIWRVSWRVSSRIGSLMTVSCYSLFARNNCLWTRTCSSISPRSSLSKILKTTMIPSNSE